MGRSPDQLAWADSGPHPSRRPPRLINVQKCANLCHQSSNTPPIRRHGHCLCRTAGSCAPCQIHHSNGPWDVGTATPAASRARSGWSHGTVRNTEERRGRGGVEERRESRARQSRGRWHVGIGTIVREGRGAATAKCGVREKREERGQVRCDAGENLNVALTPRRIAPPFLVCGGRQRRASIRDRHDSLK